jgi:RNA polymerase sigma-70 factor (ECF subfamily)
MAAKFFQQMAGRFALANGLSTMEKVTIERLVVNRADESEGFDSFFEEVYPGLVRSLWALTTELSEAEDLAQETMVRMYERWSAVQQTTSPSAYAYRTAVNLYRNRLRRVVAYLKRLPALIQSAPLEGDDVDERADVAWALKRLSTSLREAVVLVDLAGLSSEEAGRVLGITASSVRSRLLRAHRQLRQYLGGSEDE